MAHEVKVLSERKKNEWIALLEECATKYKVVNNSDRTGTEWIIQWNETVEEDRLS